MTETISDLLIKIPMFSGLDIDQLAVIKKRIKLFDVDEGDTLFEEGEQGDYVCFVVKRQQQVNVLLSPVGVG